MKKSILFLALFSLLLNAHGQDLNCKVQVTAPNLQTTDPRVFQTLQKSITDFMNGRKWTTDNFKPQERIECSLLIQVTQELGSNKYQAQLSIQSSRPVFDASYKTTVINWVDKDFQFTYSEYQPLEFSDNTYISNLTSVLAYYAFMIIGYDYDTYSLKGGTSYFQKAQAVVNMAQNAPESGWKSFDNIRNRYWLVQNLLDEKKADFRTALYKYHRDGLDNMFQNVDLARKAISESLQLLNKLDEANPLAMVIQVFFQAKSDELVNIYSKATPAEKATAVQILTKLDASHTTQYQNIMKSN